MKMDTKTKNMSISNKMKHVTRKRFANSIVFDS